MACLATTDWRAAFALAKPFLPNANAAMGSRTTMDMVFDGAPAVSDFRWSRENFDRCLTRPS
jgi:hypothetical protein